MSVEPPSAGDDYRIAAPIGCAFLARGTSGAPTLLIPLTIPGDTVGRRGGGFALTSSPRVAFDHGERRWQQPAAILESTDEALVDTFLVLVGDLGRRLISRTEEITWASVLSWVEEWQMLLGSRGGLSAEEQLGLWGELWVMSKAADADRLFEAWRGPEGEAVDFFYDGAGLEVKVSRRAHVHHISQAQVEAPRGYHDAYALSIWVGQEPVRGISLSELIEALLNAVSDAAALLRQLARVKYSPLDRDQYTTRFLVLEAPRWFRTQDVPRVRAMDDGISQVRYVATLDVDRALDRERAIGLWRHFCQIDLPSAYELVGPA